MRRDASRSDGLARREAARVDWACQSRRFDRVDFRGTNWSCDDKRATLLIRPRATAAQFSQESLLLFLLFLLFLFFLFLLHLLFLLFLLLLFHLFLPLPSIPPPPPPLGSLLPPPLPPPSLPSIPPPLSPPPRFARLSQPCFWFCHTFNFLVVCQLAFVFPPASSAASG